VPGASSETSTPQWPHTKERGNGKSGDLSQQGSGTGQAFPLLSRSAEGAGGPATVTIVGSQHAVRQPDIVVFFLWLVVAILAIILLAFVVHWAGGGVPNLRLGHFVLNVGFT